MSIPSAVDIAAFDHGAIEARMRRLVDRRRGVSAWSYKMLTGEPTYTPGHLAANMSVVEDMDAPRRCEVVAAVAANRFGLGVASGFVLIGQTVEDAELVQHFWNLDQAGRVVDASMRRRKPIGFLGKQLSERELALISRFAALDAVG